MVIVSLPTDIERILMKEEITGEETSKKLTHLNKQRPLPPARRLPTRQIRQAGIPVSFFSDQEKAKPRAEKREEAPLVTCWPY